jgi:hypothetical protein
LREVALPSISKQRKNTVRFRHWSNAPRFYWTLKLSAGGVEKIKVKSNRWPVSDDTGTCNLFFEIRWGCQDQGRDRGYRTHDILNVENTVVMVLTQFVFMFTHGYSVSIIKHQVDHFDVVDDAFC